MQIHNLGAKLPPPRPYIPIIPHNPDYCLCASYLCGMSCSPLTACNVSVLCLFQPPPQTYRQPDVPLFRNDPENSDVCCPHVALSCIPRDRPREIILLTVLTVLSMFGLRVAFVEYYHAVTLEKTDLYCALLFCFFWTWLIFVIIAAVWKSLCSGNIALLPKSK